MRPAGAGAAGGGGPPGLRPLSPGHGGRPGHAHPRGHHHGQRGPGGEARIEAIARFKRFPQGMGLVSGCIVFALSLSLVAGCPCRRRVRTTRWRPRTGKPGDPGPGRPEPGHHRGRGHWMPMERPCTTGTSAPALACCAPPWSRPRRTCPLSWRPMQRSTRSGWRTGPCWSTGGRPARCSVD